MQQAGSKQPQCKSLVDAIFQPRASSAMRPLSASTHLEDLGHRLPHLPLADAPVAVDVQVEEGLCRLGWGKKVLQVCSRGVWEGRGRGVKGTEGGAPLEK